MLQTPCPGFRAAAGLLLFGLALAAAAAPAAGDAGTTYDFESVGRATRMWVPDGLAAVRGILIEGNPYGGDARQYVDNQALRGFARRHGFVVIATAYWGRFLPGEIEIWDQHLAALAAASGRPELMHAPWAALGFSNGGQMAYGLNALRPEKCLGFVANKGGYYNDPLPPEASLATPGILVAGELDSEFRRTVIHGLFDENRPRGALWAWVEEQGMGHEGDAERLFLPFLAECVRLRYPAGERPTATEPVTLAALTEESGWLADQATWNEPLTVIAPYAEYPGDPAAAGWVPSAASAFAYRAFATRAAWIEVSGGQVLDRPLHIEVPGFGDYWGQPAGESPWSQTITIDTSEYHLWTAVEFYSGAELLATVLGGGGVQDYLMIEIDLQAGVHGLSALVTDQDGTVRTTGLRHVVVLDPPPLVPALGGPGRALLAAGMAAALARRRRGGRRP